MFVFLSVFDSGLKYLEGSQTQGRPTFLVGSITFFALPGFHHEQHKGIQAFQTTWVSHMAATTGAFNWSFQEAGRSNAPGGLHSEPLSLLLSCDSLYKTFLPCAVFIYREEGRNVQTQGKEKKPEIQCSCRPKACHDGPWVFLNRNACLLLECKLFVFPPLKKKQNPTILS